MAADQYDPNLGTTEQGGPNQGAPYGGAYQGGPPGTGGGQYRGPGGPYGHGSHHPEKQDEKEQEKQQEKGHNMDEKYHRDPVRFFSWGLLIVWLGVVLLLQNVNALNKDDQGWGLFFWGWGALVLLEAVIRLFNPRWTRPAIGSFVFGAVLVGVGFGLWFGTWAVIGPIVIIAVGVAILAGRLVRHH